MEKEERLKALRAQMKKEGIGVLLIRATDRYFNEYVPLEQNQRAWLTGFTGSAGDLLVTQKFATIFTDGRYSLQAAQQAPEFSIDIVPLGKTIQHQWLNLISNLKGLSEASIYVDTQSISPHTLRLIEESAISAGLEVHARNESFLEKIGFKGESEQNSRELRVVSAALCGQSVEEKLKELQVFLNERRIQGLMLTQLDEIAWLSNLRGSDFQHQSTFGGRALVLQDKILLGLSDYRGQKSSGVLELMSEEQMWQKIETIASQEKIAISVDELRTPHDVVQKLGAFAELRFMSSPIRELKAKKNQQELLHMRNSFFFS